MDRKSLVLIVIFIIIVLFSVVATFRRYVVMEDITYETDEDAFQEFLLEE